MAAKKDGDSPDIAKVIEEILDKREQRSREEKDPKARFDRVMDRLEGFLDGLSEGEGKEKGSKGGEKEDEGPITALFGRK